MKTIASLLHRRMCTPRRFVRSTLGPQALSTRLSSPAYGFGHASREARAKAYLSPEHERAEAGRTSAAAQINMAPSSVGKQISSRELVAAPTQARAPTADTSNLRAPRAGKTSSPAFGFPSTPRFYAERPPSSQGAGAGSAGGRSSSRSRSPRSTPSVSDGPGPAAYMSRSSLGPQCDSRFLSSRTATLNTASRADASRAYISKTHDRLSAGQDGPGPASAAVQEPMGAPQISSRRPTSPSFRFSRSLRPGIASEVPPCPRSPCLSEKGERGSWRACSHAWPLRAAGDQRKRQPPEHGGAQPQCRRRAPPISRSAREPTLQLRVFHARGRDERVLGR